MGVDFQPNEVVCPHCNKQFIHNKINGIALLEIATGVEARKRMHCRLTLDSIERTFNGDVPRPIKKAVLDGYNDLSRDVLTILGFAKDLE